MDAVVEEKTEESSRLNECGPFVEVHEECLEVVVVVLVVALDIVVTNKLKRQGR